MSLSPGKRVGTYQVLELLGAGGMGEVYRASDSRLRREVALKSLPEGVSRDPDRLARFEREAQMLAALNHPNIAAIYGVEEADGLRCLVLELVPGETLAERIGRGALALGEALGIALQIASALEAAHERGIIHRDLKPANVKVTPDGAVKVLDFGLAKAFEKEGGAAAGSAAVDGSRSPTLSMAATRAGVILGTAAYMSPEQARGAALDRRTDIWSFGCVVYELLTGRVAFAGLTISDTLAAVLKTEPDWTALPADTPAAVRNLLRRCLEKDARRRLRDIGDARIEIEEILSRPAGAAAMEPGEAGGLPASTHAVARAARSRRLAWGMTGLMGVIACVSVWSSWSQRGVQGPPGRTVRVEVSLPSSDSLVLSTGPSLALAPDGSRLVYVADRGGVRQLFSRRLDRHGAEPIAGTEGGYVPFFSPDSRWVGFSDWNGRKLKKVPLDGGAPETLCQELKVTSARWSADGTIVFTTWPEGHLMRLPAAGGTPQLVAAPDKGANERFLISPVLLPGVDAVLATVVTTGEVKQRIAAFSLDAGEGQSKAKTLLVGATFARFVPPATLIFTRPDGNVFAAPFDPARVEITGVAVPILGDVRVDTWAGEAFLDVAGEGVLAYVQRQVSNVKRVLVWVDRKGMEQPLTGVQQAYCDPNLSPDGRKLAVGIQVTPQQDLWIHDLERETLTRATFAAEPEMAPVWSPDGRRLAYDKDDPMGLFWRPADGSGKEEQLLQSEYPMHPVSWSADGRTIAVEAMEAESSDIMFVRVGGTVNVEKFLATPFDERHPQFFPDGKWIAYTSNESGRDEVYVQASSSSGAKWQISADGGQEPRWARDGRELFYRSGERLMAVSIRTVGGFTAGRPQILFSGRYANPGAVIQYDVAPDGQRFLMLKDAEEQPPTRIHLVLNWAEELKRLEGSQGP